MRIANVNVCAYVKHFNSTYGSVDLYLSRAYNADDY